MNKKIYKNRLYTTRQISNLKELIDGSAALYAEKTAFYVKDVPGGAYRPIPYKKFKQDIDALGTALIAKGFKDKKIALIGENSYEWAVTYCAVANGTGVIVPLDRELYADEIRALLSRAGVAAVVYSQKLGDKIGEAFDGVETLEETILMEELPALTEEGRRLVTNGDRRFINAEIDDEAMCALLFTSGTMGMAKGVMLSHKNIASNVYNMSKYVKIAEPGIGLSVLPMHHTYEMTCHIFTGLYQGIAIAICEGLKYIVKNMSEIKATVMLGVPLLFESMHKKVWKQAETSGRADKLRAAINISRKFKLYNHPKITQKMFGDIHAALGGNIGIFIAGGAAINPKVIEDFEAMGFPMIQGYGMTENAPIIAVNRDTCSKAAAAGFVMPETEVKIVDADGSGMGEIVCRGPSVMLGYYDDPEETAKVLKDGWLYTGDYGYFGEDGRLYVSGRKKNVIVTKNGKNIFPEEVEFYLAKSPYIREALVHGIDDEKTGDIVVKAEIFPDYEYILAQNGSLSKQEITGVIKKEIESVNDLMPLYKRVKRFDLRKTEFSKTTTRKIKRYTAENYTETNAREEKKC